MAKQHLMILYGGDWLRRENCGDDIYDQPQESHSITVVQVPLNFNINHLRKEVAILLGNPEMSAVSISCLVLEKATNLKRRLLITDEQTLRYYLMNTTMPTFFVPKPSHQTKECESFSTPPNRNNKTRVEYNHAPETPRVKNRCNNGKGSVVSDSLWKCVDVMRLFPTDIQFHIFERVYRTHSADVARSCNLVMMREEGNTFIDPVTRSLPINTLERVVPTVLTPADVAMNRTSYLWLFSLCCYNKIPVIFQFIGSECIEEPGYFKKFLELFYPIGWWKSMLERTYDEKYLVLLNIQRELKQTEDGSIYVTLKTTLEVPEADYCYVSPVVNPSGCRKYFDKMCALNRVEMPSDLLYENFRRHIQQNQYFFLNREWN